MKARASVEELAEHIRAEVRRRRGETTPPVPGAAAAQCGWLVSPPPPFPPPPPKAAFLEGIVAGAARLVAKARQKVAVNARVPKLLRPFYRNQGGYNGVVLEALDVLCDVNRQLVAENERLRAHLTRQEEWMSNAARGLHDLHIRTAILEHQRGVADINAGLPPGEAAASPLSES